MICPLSLLRDSEEGIRTMAPPSKAIEPANLPVPHFGSGAFAGTMVPLLPLPEESLDRVTGIFLELPVRH
jgi:hypothetical protein